MDGDMTCALEEPSETGEAKPARKVRKGKVVPFTKVYPAGWSRVESLLTAPGGATVGRLWLFIVRSCDKRNALVVSNKVLSEELGVSERSVARAVALLVKDGAVKRYKIGTGSCFVLNDGETWRDDDGARRYCTFNAKAFVGVSENPSVARTLRHRLPSAVVEGDQ